MPFLDSAIFLLSSSITLGLIYYKIPVSTVNIFLIVLLILAILLSTKANSTNTNSIIKKISNFCIIFISSLFIQIFVTSSGGFYSPFLIIIYLYSITLSFLLNLSSSIVFLIASFVLLIIDTSLNQAVFLKFKEDPFTLILYVVSFIVIIPLAQVVNKTYHIKDKASEKLKDLVDLGTSREESILRSLEELVVVTDINLTILSANGSFEKTMHMASGDYTNKPILDVLQLTDQNGIPLTKDSLFISQIIQDKATRIMEGLYLKTKLKPQPQKINIHLRPIRDSKDNVNQIVFIFTDKNLAKQTTLHEDLAKLRTANQLLFNQIRSSLLKANIPDLKLQFELFAKAEEDLIISQELEDHTIKEFKQLKDLALLCKKLSIEKSELAGSMGVNLKFSLPENETSEIEALKMLDSKSPFARDIISDFTFPFDNKWVEIMLSKQIDLCILLSSNQQNPIIEFSIFREDHIIKTKLSCHTINIGIDYQILFKPYYDNLSLKTNLKLGSGLEGYISKLISSQLGHPLAVEYIPATSQLVLITTFTR